MTKNVFVYIDSIDALLKKLLQNVKQFSSYKAISFFSISATHSVAVGDKNSAAS